MTDDDGVSRDEAQRSVDALVGQALRYRDSGEFVALLRFAGRFRSYSPFNALLVHVQRPGSRFVATPGRWLDRYDRRVLPGQAPIVIMQPFGPVMFVYDVSQTEEVEGGRGIPRMTLPFAMPPMRNVAVALDHTVRNARADGVRVHRADRGSHAAGCIWPSRDGGSQVVEVRRRPPESVLTRVRYETEVNAGFTPTEAYATLAHELAHLYCGHIGTHHAPWWPDRRGVPEPVAEFEAEAAAYIACVRLDDDAELPPYLHQHIDRHGQVPEGISLDAIMTSAGRLVELTEAWLPPRRDREAEDRARLERARRRRTADAESTPSI